MPVIYFVYFLSLVLGVLSSIVAEGPCPEVKPAKNFNLTALTQSTLYEIARYPDEWETPGDCLKISFTKNDNVIQYKYTEVVNDKANVITDGYVDYDNKDSKDGMIDWRSKFFVDLYGKNVTSYFLMADYNNYYLTYNCKYDDVKKVRYDSVWVLSPNTKLKPEDKTTVINFMKSSKFLDADKLVWDVFNEDSCKPHMK